MHIIIYTYKQNYCNNKLAVSEKQIYKHGLKWKYINQCWCAFQCFYICVFVVIIKLIIFQQCAVQLGSLLTSQMSK